MALRVKKAPSQISYLSIALSILAAVGLVVWLFAFQGSTLEFTGSISETEDKEEEKVNREKSNTQTSLLSRLSSICR